MSEAEDLRARLRVTAQILIDEVGADGPTNTEQAAVDAVHLIKNLRAELSTAYHDVNTLLAISAAFNHWANKNASLLRDFAFAKDIPQWPGDTGWCLAEEEYRLAKSALLEIGKALGPPRPVESEPKRTCGECGHWQAGPHHPKRGECCKEVPPWAWRAIENIPGTVACYSDSDQADDCDCFKPPNKSGY